MNDSKDIHIDGDVSGGNVNFGGTQKFYGPVNIYSGASPETSVNRKTRIFISYARADDESFVKRLYDDLKDEFEVWWDRVSMPNRGLTFLQEIRDAIDWADRLLLVAGPRAFTSDYVRDEWQYAYEQGKAINIALRLGEYSDLPIQLSVFDAPDFRDDADYDERLATLKRQLAEHLAPMGAFYSVPAVPPHFLKRREALDALRELVISDVDKPTLISAEKRTTVVEGMGGIGKSALAVAFAHDRKVRFAFPDGIVWLTAGRTPNIYELYRAIGIALGDNQGNYRDESSARQNAQKALADKKCLLILDDVWELPIARSFRDLISGTSARLLITTRNLQINNQLDANEYRLKLINKSQAVDYLRSWVGDDPKLDEIAEKLGYLFLALSLAGRLMKENSLAGREYLSMFERVSDMEISPEREDSLEISITLGVDAAFAAYSDRKFLYHTFGLFQEDVPVPQRTIIQLWSHLRPDIRPIDHLKTLTTLVNLGLVERHKDKAITLHDLLHSYTREKLGDRYVQTSQDLLNSYNPPPEKPWHEIMDDGYFYNHLAYHLIQAKRDDELFSLLTSSPNWMERKFIVCFGDASYVDDLQQSLASISSPLSPKQLLESVRLYAAQQAAHSRAKLYSDDSLQVLTWLGQIDEALTHARLRTELSYKIAGLVAIGDILITQENQQRAREILQEAHKICLAISDNRTKVKSLGNVAESLAKLDVSLSEVLLEEAEAAVFDMPDKEFRDKELKGDAISNLAHKCAASGKIEKASHLLEWWISNFSVGTPGDEEDEKNFHFIRTALKLSASLGLYGQKSIPRALALVDEVLQDVDKVVNPFNQVIILTGAAHILARTKDTRRAAECVHKAFDVARRISMGRFSWSEVRPEIRVNALSQVAIAAARIADIALARNIINEIDGNLPYYRAKALCFSSIQLKHIDRITEANEFVEEAYKTVSALKEETPKHMAELMGDIATAYAMLEDNQRAKETLRQSKEYAVNIVDNSTHANAIIKVAAVFARNGFFDRALKIASLIQEQENEYKKAISIISQELAKTGEVSRAYEIIQSIDFYHRSSAALQDIAVGFARLGDFDQAIKIASREIVYAHEKAIALAAVAGEIALHTDDLVLIEKVFEQALRENDGSPTEDLRWAAMLGIAEGRLRAGQLEQARSILDSAFDNALGENWMTMGWIDGRYNVTKLVEILSKIGDLPKSLICFDRLHSAWSHDREIIVQELCDIAGILIDAGEIERAEMLVDDAMEAADKRLGIGYGWWEAFPSIALMLAKTFEKNPKKLSENIDKIITYISNLEPDYGIQLAADWEPAFEIIQPGLALEVLGETIRILGWARPDWQRVYDLITVS